MYFVYLFICTVYTGVVFLLNPFLCVTCATASMKSSILIKFDL